MKSRVRVSLLLLCAGALLGGCTGGPAPTPAASALPAGPGEGLAPGEGVELSGGRFRSTDHCLAYFRAILPPGAPLDGCLEKGI
jgi:hypothetical protein